MASDPSAQGAFSEHFQRGSGFYQQGCFAEAVKELHEAIRINPYGSLTPTAVQNIRRSRQENHYGDCVFSIFMMAPS